MCGNVRGKRVAKTHGKSCEFAAEKETRKRTYVRAKREEIKQKEKA